jgi:hypothetical protein
MKKMLRQLTGIVFMFTILIAAGCGPSKDPGTLEDLEEVIIYVKAYEKEGVKQLEIFDSNNSAVVVDNHTVIVKEGTKVFWVLADDSGLKKIKKVGPKGEGRIMPGNARGIWLFTKYKKHKVPDGQTSGDQQAYYITVKDLDGDTWTIDPYLRIR